MFNSFAFKFDCDKDAHSPKWVCIWTCLRQQPQYNPSYCPIHPFYKLLVMFRVAKGCSSSHNAIREKYSAVHLAQVVSGSLPLSSSFTVHMQQQQYHYTTQSSLYSPVVNLIHVLLRMFTFGWRKSVHLNHLIPSCRWINDVSGHAAIQSWRCGGVPTSSAGWLQRGFPCSSHPCYGQR